MFYSSVRNLRFYLSISRNLRKQKRLLTIHDKIELLLLVRISLSIVFIVITALQEIKLSHHLRQEKTEDPTWAASLLYILATCLHLSIDLRYFFAARILDISQPRKNISTNPSPSVTWAHLHRSKTQNLPHCRWKAEALLNDLLWSTAVCKEAE